MEYVITAVCWGKDGTLIDSFEKVYKSETFAKKRYDELVELYSKYHGWAVWFIPRVEIPKGENSIFKKIGLS